MTQSSPNSTTELAKELVNNFDLNPMSLKNRLVSSVFHVNIKQKAAHLQRNPPSLFQKKMTTWVELFTTSVLLNTVPSSLPSLISF